MQCDAEYCSEGFQPVARVTSDSQFQMAVTILLQAFCKPDCETRPYDICTVNTAVGVAKGINFQQISLELYHVGGRRLASLQPQEIYLQDLL